MSQLMQNEGKVQNTNINNSTNSTSHSNNGNSIIETNKQLIQSMPILNNVNNAKVANKQETIEVKSIDTNKTTVKILKKKHLS